MPLIYMNGNRQLTADKLNMEEKILKAAEKLFVEKGYAMTSTTEIAKEAGCKQTLVHYYFRTKEKLFNIVLAGKVKNVFKQFISLQLNDGNFEEKLTSLIEIHFDTVRENSNMILFLMNELRRNPALFENLIKEIGDIPRQTLDALQKDLNKEIAAGHIRQISMQQLVLNIISMNVFIFTIKPIAVKIWNMDDVYMENLLDERKKEIVNTILLSLRP